MKKEETLTLFYKLSTSMITIINNELRKYQLTFQQYLILLFIDNQDQEVVGKDICQYLDLTHPTVVGLVYRMVNSDLVITHSSLNDRRQTAVLISQHGKTVLNKATKAIDQLDIGFNALNKEESQQLISLLIKVSQNMKGVQK